MMDCNFGPLVLVVVLALQVSTTLASSCDSGFTVHKDSDLPECGDYAGVRSTTVDECCTACAADRFCHAAVFVPHAKECVLKTSVHDCSVSPLPGAVLIRRGSTPAKSGSTGAPEAHPKVPRTVLDDAQVKVPRAVPDDATGSPTGAPTGSETSGTTSSGTTSSGTTSSSSGTTSSGTTSTGTSSTGTTSTGTTSTGSTSTGEFIDAPTGSETSGTTSTGTTSTGTTSTGTTSTGTTSTGSTSTGEFIDAPTGSETSGTTSTGTTSTGTTSTGTTGAGEEAVSVRMRLDMPFEHFDGQAFVCTVAQIINTSCSYVRFDGARPGSVIVDFSLLPDGNGPASDAFEALNASVASGEFSNATGIPVLEFAVVPPPVTTGTTSSGTTSSGTTSSGTTSSGTTSSGTTSSGTTSSGTTSSGTTSSGTTSSGTTSSGTTSSGTTSTSGTTSSGTTSSGTTSSGTTSSGTTSSGTSSSGTTSSGTTSSGTTSSGTTSSGTVSTTGTTSIPAATTAAAAPSTCKTFTNRDWSGFDVGVVNNTLDSQSCCRACSWTAACNAFTWNRWTKQCWMKNITGETSLEYHPYGVAGVPCNNQSCFSFRKYNHSDFLGHDLAKLDGVTSFAACNQACLDLAGDKLCNGYTYNPVLNKCFLKDLDHTRMVLDVIAAEAGIPCPNGICPRSCRTFKKHLFVGGNLGAAVSNVRVVGDCCQLCYTTGGCNAWSYDTKDKLCQLKTVAPDAPLVPNTAYHSGRPCRGIVNSVC